MTTIELNEPFNAALALPIFEEAFPDYQVRNVGIGRRNMIIRKRLFTTQTVSIIPVRKSNKVRIQTQIDMIPMYVFFFWPFALYIAVRRRKDIAKLKEKAIEVLNQNSVLDQIGKE